MRDEGHFAQAAGAVIGLEKLVQNRLSGTGTRFSDAPAFEPHLDTIEQTALMGQGLGSAYVPVNPSGVRRGKDLLSWNIGVADNAIAGLRSAAVPGMAIGQPHPQIGAGAGEMQRSEALIIQPACAPFKFGIVRLPCGDRIVAGDT